METVKQVTSNPYVIATTSLKITNKPLSKLKSKVSHRDHKRTQQEVPTKLLPYWYYICMVHVNNK